MVGVSQCLGFGRCRYDGRTIHHDFIEELKPHVRFLPVCPEMTAGLGVPRAPIRLVRDHHRLRLIQPATKRDLTGRMSKVAAQIMRSTISTDGYILKARSPSCGLHDAKVFPDRKSMRPIGCAPGVFGKAVCRRFRHLAITDERALDDPSARGRFLSRLFAAARFRAVKRSRDPATLVAYHESYQELLAIHDPAAAERMKKIAHRASLENIDRALEQYRQCLDRFWLRRGEDPTGKKAGSVSYYLVPRRLRPQ